MKTSLKYIEEQKEIAQSEINYFKLLKYQISDCSINEALEIQDELINNKYLFKHSDSKPKKKQKPKLLTYILDNNTLIIESPNLIKSPLLNKDPTLKKELNILKYKY